MIDHTASALFLLKAENNEVFGPINFQQLNTWATSAQISPLDKVSTDQQTWFKAPMVPELGMDWLIELTSDQLYGPTTLGALQEFLNLGEDQRRHPAHQRPRRHGDDRARNRYADDPAEEPEETDGGEGPVRTGIRISLQQRIRELESTLFEERRTREALEPDSAPLCEMTDEGASVMLRFATRITSGPLSAEPASSTVMLAVVAVTKVPSVPVLRLPPMRRLSAPNALSEVASRLSASASAWPLGPKIRMSVGLLMSTSPPRPLAGACAASEPSIDICRVLSNSRRPESIGSRGTAALLAVAACFRKVFAE